MDYLIRTAGTEKGPYTINQLRSMWASGAITKRDEFRMEDAVEWRPLEDLIRSLEPAASTHPHREVVEEVRRASERAIYFEARKKSVPLAVTLNVVFPGVGFMYCGRVLSGLLALVFGYTAILVTGGIAALIILPWYGFSAMYAARRVNAEAADMAMDDFRDLAK